MVLYLYIGVAKYAWFPQDNCFWGLKHMQKSHQVDIIMKKEGSEEETMATLIAFWTAGQTEKILETSWPPTYAGRTERLSILQK